MNKTTQPFKSKKKVNDFLAYLKGKSERNYMIAKMQLNTARRISDIVGLKASNIMHPNGEFKDYITVAEKKTGKTAKIPINGSLIASLKEFITSNSITYDSYLFQSRKGDNKPLTTTQIHRIFFEAAQALNLENFGTHSLRKTWGYFCYKETKDIALIMEVFNHTSVSVTLRYIGITQSDIDNMYKNIEF